MHAPELMRMGARIDVHGGTARVTGRRAAARRAGDGDRPARQRRLILAGLGAEGETVVSRVYHLDRGYEHVEEKLGACGARIERVAG